MSGGLRKVRSGEAFRPLADDWNAFIDAALDQRNRERSRKRPETASPDRRNGVLLVRNDAGTDLDRFSVVGLDAPVIRPADNEAHFANRIALTGVLPEEGTHEGRFAVLREPIRSGAFGRAWALGVFPAHVDVEHEDHDRAEMADGATDALLSGKTGSARILWKEEGTGRKWAVVRVPAGAPVGVLDNPVDETYSAEHPETISTANEYATDDGAEVLWDREEPPPGGEKGIEITLSAGIAYYHNGDEVLYDYLLNFEIDDLGAIRRITAKRRQEVDAPEECP
jgi:hypothetical protein